MNDITEMANKLVLLFIFEKMEFPLTELTLAEVISSNNYEWLSFLDFTEALEQLCDAGFIHQGSVGKDGLYYITDSGRGCLSHFYTKIPASVREEIMAYAKANKNRFKRSQEYTYDYFKTRDGGHMAVFRIRENRVADNLLEISIKVPTRNMAQRATSKWRDKAAQVYEELFHSLFDE